MTDREILLIAYGALQALEAYPLLLSMIEAQIYAGSDDKPSEPAQAEPEKPFVMTYNGMPMTPAAPKPTAPTKREPGTPGVDRPLKRGDVLK